jgi:hypothetical protein
MCLPKFRYTVLVAAILGVEVPMIAMAGFQLRLFSTPEFGWLHWLPYVWPTSVWLLPFDTPDPTPFSFARLAWSIAFNVLLYVIVFSLFWSLGWVFRAWRASLCDGTTI